MSMSDVFSVARESFKFTKTVTIKGVKYGISVLNMGQEKKVSAYLDSLNQDDTDQYINELRKAIVAESIISINDETLGKTIKVPDADGKEVEKDKAIAIKDFLTESPTALVSELFDAYVDVKEQSEDILKKEMKYDWFKTPEQRSKETEASSEKEKESDKKEEEPDKEEVSDIKLTKINETDVNEIKK